jgi:hypothetical protein
MSILTCDPFDILDLFPPDPSGGMCFEEDGEIDPEPLADPPPIDPPGNQTAGLEQAATALRKRAQAAETKLAAYEAAQVQAAAAAAAKRGEFEELYTASKSELAEAQGLLAAFETADAERTERLTTANAAALALLPETMRALVPTTLDPEATAEQIRRVSSMLTTATPTGGIIGGGKPPADGDKIPQAYLERANDEARRYSMEPATYWRVRLRPSLVREGKLKA